MGTRSAVVKPTSARDGSQTGIQPPLTTTAKAFEATPTMTTSIPGTARLCQSAIEQQPEGAAEERQAQRVGDGHAVGDGQLGAEADHDGQEEETRPADPGRRAGCRGVRAGAARARTR